MCSNFIYAHLIHFHKFKFSIFVVSCLIVWASLYLTVSSASQVHEPDGKTLASSI